MIRAQVQKGPMTKQEEKKRRNKLWYGMIPKRLLRKNEDPMK